MSISDRKLDDSALDTVNGGLFGFAEDTKTLYCTNCKQPFKIPAARTSGKCPDCGRLVSENGSGSFSGSILKA